MKVSPAPELASVRLPRADAVRNRAKVLAAARTTFAHSGVDAPVEEIARAAGVGVGTIYRHFPTKRDLLDALVVEYFTDLIDHTQHVLDAGGEPGPALFGVLHYYYDAHGRDRMFDILAAAMPTAAKEKSIQDLCDVLDRLIDRAREAGAVRPDFCADDVGVIMCGLAMARQAEVWYRGEDPARRFFAFVLDGLRPPAR